MALNILTSYPLRRFQAGVETMKIPITGIPPPLSSQDPHAPVRDEISAIPPAHVLPSTKEWVNQLTGTVGGVPVMMPHHSSNVIKHGHAVATAAATTAATVTAAKGSPVARRLCVINRKKHNAPVAPPIQPGPHGVSGAWPAPPAGCMCLPRHDNCLACGVSSVAVVTQTSVAADTASGTMPTTSAVTDGEHVPPSPLEPVMRLPSQSVLAQLTSVTSAKKVPPKPGGSNAASRKRPSAVVEPTPEGTRDAQKRRRKDPPPHTLERNGSHA